MVRPPGWPAELPDPQDDEFPARATQWLLDACPADYRGSLVFRRHPQVLARVAAHHAEGNLAAARAAYSAARRELSGVVAPDVVEETLVALARHGAHLASVVREVGLVEEALAGRRWRAKL